MHARVRHMCMWGLGNLLFIFILSCLTWESQELYEALEEVKIFISELVQLSLFAFPSIIGRVLSVCVGGFVEEVKKQQRQSVF